MTGTRADFEAILRLVVEHTGLRCPPERGERAEAAIRRAIERSGVATAEAYLDLLRHEDAALDELAGELMVGETYFFREPSQFTFLRQEVLPDLCRRRGPGPLFQVWSAGCATGEEAYSLAILLEQEGLADRARILATDICRKALARARQAAYSSWSLRGEGAALAQPYLSRRGQCLVLSDRIRRRVRFEYLNLVRADYPSITTGIWGMDLILCRNVLIYLEPEAARQVAGRLFQSLAPGGWLLTASSDPPLQEWAPLETVVTEAGVFYRRGEAISAEIEEPTPASKQTVPELQPADSQDNCREAPISEQRLRQLAAEDAAEAERACAAAVAAQPLSVELHYLHAVLRMELGRDEEAINSLRKAIYLDRSLAVAHFTLGALLGRRGDRDGARLAYRNALALCLDRPAEEPVPLADGESAGRLAQAAVFQLELLDESRRAVR